jgi:general secretion pathway protein D
VKPAYAMVWTLLVALLSPGVLSAQATTQPATQPASPASEAPPAPVVGPDEIIMAFKDAPLDAVLREMSEQLGLVIVNSTDANGRVTVVSRQPLSVDEAVETLNTVLKANGYAAVRAGRLLRIVTLEEASKSNIPVRSGSDLDQIGQGDTLVRHVIPVRYVEAENLTRDLADIIPAYANLASNKASNVLIYTATESDVHHLVEVVRALDVQVSQSDAVRVFPLEYADADATARLIEEVFASEDSSSSSRDRQRRQFMGPRGMFRPPGGEDADSGSGVRQQRVVAAADDQTNSVVISAPPELMEVIAEVIESLDNNPTVEESIFVYPLTNAKASDLESVLQDIFDEDSTSSSRTTGSSQNFRGRQQQRPGQQTASTTTSVGDLAGKVYVVAEENTNSLLVRTAPKYFDRVKAILEELDRPTRQVLIKVLIAEITLNDSLDLGTEFSVLNIEIGSGKGQIGTDFGIAQLGNGLVGKYVVTDFETTLRALQQVGKLDILSRPYLLCSENQEASITVGEEVPYISNSRTTDTGQTVNTVEYRDIGIIMDVTPYVGPDGMVILDLAQEISSSTGQTVTVSEDFTAEIYAKRSAETRVAVANGRTVVIGGLMQDSITETVDKVPLLGDIPYLGALFSRIQKNKSKTELLIFLCPQTALTPDELETVTQRAREHADLVQDAVRPGAFDHTMRELRGEAEPPEKQADPSDADEMPAEQSEDEGND